MIILCILIARWRPKSADTHSEYVILIDFPLQQWLHESSSLLRDTYIVCVVVVHTQLKIVTTASEQETHSLGCRYAIILEEPIQIVCNAVVWFSKRLSVMPSFGPVSASSRGRSLGWWKLSRFEISFRNRGRKLVSFPTDTSKVPWGEPTENVCGVSQL
jgi:hypothetical protein